MSGSQGIRGFRLSTKFLILSLLPKLIYAAPELVIEAFGDSLTAGMIADSNVTKDPSLSYVSSVLSKFAMYKLNQDRSYIIELEKNDVAWPAQLSKRLSTHENAIEVRNYGVSGAKVEHLPIEVTQAQPASAVAKTIAFFFIGHNDLCHNPAEPEQLGKDFSNPFSTAISEWDKRHKGAVAYFIPVGNIQDVYPTLDKMVWFQGPKARYSCVDSWTKFFPYCTKFYKRHASKTLESYLVPRIQKLNENLKDLAHRWAGQSIRNQFYALEFAHYPKFEKHHFAVDCYHLSEDGHGVLSDLVYDELKWRN